MKLSEVITLNQIIPTLKISGKKQILAEISRIAAEQIGVKADDVLQALLDREKQAGTGIGFGVAIPHGCVEGINKVHVYFARLVNKVDFKAHDGIDADLIFVILTSHKNNGEYLTTLASLSRLISNERIRTQLRGAESAEAILATITEFE